MKKTLLKSIFVLLISIFLASGALLLNNYSGEHSDVNPGNEVEYVKPIKRGKHIRCNNKSADLQTIMDRSDYTYIIEKDYAFVDTLVIPPKCELLFEGGSLRGPIRFNDTYLSGNINLKGSNLFGSISNNMFNTNWICYRDGVHDDAENINNALRVCDSLYIDSGDYLLKQPHEPNHNVPLDLSKSIEFYIGIFRSGISISSDNDAVLIADNPRTIVCVYSEPGNISDQIKRISINGVRIKCNNNGNEFNEFCHSIKLVGVTGCMITGCAFDDFWGDAICLSHYGDTPSTGERTRNSNVRILSNVIYGGSHNNRNGISIISGDHVLVDGNKIYETSKKGMPGAIDVEPNNSAYTIDDIIISKNIITSSKGSGICLVSPGEGAPLYNITIKGNRVSKVSYGVAVIINSNNSTANFDIYDNVFSETYKDYLFSGIGDSKNWKIQNNSSTPSPDRDFKKGLKVSGLSIECNKK